MDDAPTALPAWPRTPDATDLSDEATRQAAQGLDILRAKSSPDLANRPPAHETALHGLITTHPAVALLIWCGTDEIRDTTWTLGRWVAAAIAKLALAERTGEAAAAIDAACRAVRLLKPTGHDDLDRDVAHLRDELKLDRAWECLKAVTPKNRKQAARIDAIERLLAFALQVRDPKPRPPGSPRTKGTDTGTDSGTDGGSEAATGTDSAPQKTTPAARRPRAAPAQVAAARSKAQRIKNALPTALHAYDWEVLLDSMKETSLLVRAVVGGLLASGLPSCKLRKCRVIGSIADAPTDGEEPCLALAEQVFLMRNRVNPLYKDQRDATAARWVVLPMQPWGRGIDALLAHARSRCGQALFTQEQVGEASQHLRRLRERLATTLSPLRIAAQLGDALRACTGDDVAEVCVLGRPAKRHVRARLHYWHISLQQVSEWYAQATARVQAELGCSGPTRLLDPARLAGGYVGSHRVPDLVEAQRWIRDLYASVSAAPMGAPTAAKIAEFHNNYVAHTAMFLLWSTGVRPTARGLASLAPCGRHVLTDEKRKSQRAVRNLVLPEKALEQWKNYQAHCAQVLTKLKTQTLPTWFTLEVDGKGRLRVSPLAPKQLNRLARNPFESNGNRQALANWLRHRGWPSYRINLWMGHAALGEEPGAPYSAAEPGFSAREIADIADFLNAHWWTPCEGLGRG